MIKIYFFKNNQNKIFGFEIKNHCKDIVCSAISILSLNTCNCIEKFTNSKFYVDYNPKGGFLRFELKDKININSETLLILNCFEFGILSTKAEYPKEISIDYIDYKEV